MQTDMCIRNVVACMTVLPLFITLTSYMDQLGYMSIPTHQSRLRRVMKNLR
jgi:hypothetical protein